MKTPPRRLAFEQLEQKLSPTGMLLAVTTADDSVQIELEKWMTERPTDISGYAWTSPHEAEQILRFVEQQTSQDAARNQPWRTPSPDDCAAADKWLRLETTDVRMLVICATYPLRQA